MCAINCVLKPTNIGRYLPEGLQSGVVKPKILQTSCEENQCVSKVSVSLCLPLRNPIWWLEKIRNKQKNKQIQ